MKAFDQGYEYGVAQRAAGGAAAFKAAALEAELVGSTQEAS